MRYYFFNKYELNKINWNMRRKISVGRIDPSLSNLIYLRVEAYSAGGLIEALFT